jgi:GntR family transcriptional regulator
MAVEELAKYQRIAGELRDLIRSGGYAPGARLPSKAELIGHYEVAQRTVDEALRVLREEGLVYSVQGVGTFVSDPLPEVARSEYETVMQRIDGLTEEVRQLRGEVASLRQAREA